MLASVDAGAASTMRPHAVMVTIPMLGHINPFLHLAKALVAHHNFTVTFVNNRFYYDYILSRESQLSGAGGPSATSSSCHGKLHFEWVQDGLPPDFDYVNIWQHPDVLYQGCLNMVAPLKALMERLNQESPFISCFIFGSFMPGVHKAAMELGIPRVVFWSQSATVFSIYYHLSLLEANGFFPFKRPLPGCKEDNSAVVPYIPGVPPLLPADFPTFLHAADASDRLVMMLDAQFKTVKECSTVVINSFQELEREAFEALQAKPQSVFAVGPLLADQMQAQNGRLDLVEESPEEIRDRDKSLRWLDKQSKQSVLYISFGTIGNPSAGAMEGIALGLKESKQPFIWVIRPTSFYNSVLGTRTAFESAVEILPDGFIEDMKDVGLVVTWAPQQEVLAHPSIGAFLTHCGWNSTLEGLSMGVPMIALPRESDQTTNCKHVVDIWKVGVQIECKEDGSVECAEVVRVFDMMLRGEEGQEMRQRARMVRDSARRAKSESSRTALHRFSEAMSSQKHQVNCCQWHH